jgi:predicted nucleic acid-binding protein
MRVALDTNVLAYAEGVSGEEMRDRALSLIACLPSDAVVLPVQTLGELFQVLTRKAGRPQRVAREHVLTWRAAFALMPTSPTAILMATDLVITHSFSFWDAVILGSAAEAECHLLLSEDKQHGFVWQGVTIVNPFVRPPHPLLRALIGQA